MLRSRWSQKWQNSIVAGVAVESMCAELMTLPFVLYVFGQMSFIGLLANVLVVALVPLAMLLTLIAGLAGMLLPAFAGWLAWPARIVLTYMLDIANMLSHIPHIFAQNLGFPIMQMLLAYSALGVLTLALKRRTKKPKLAIITDRSLAKWHIAGKGLRSDARVL
jgi:predicted membrane metal-binding protein